MTLKTICPGPALIRREGMVHQGVILVPMKEIQHLLPVVIKEVPELQDLIVLSAVKEGESQHEVKLKVQGEHLKFSVQS